MTVKQNFNRIWIVMEMMLLKCIPLLQQCTIYLGVVSQTYRKLSKVISRKYTMPDYNYDENFKLKLCTCAQSMASGTHTKFQLAILTRSTICAIHNFQENVLECSRDSETPPSLCKVHPHPICPTILPGVHPLFSLAGWGAMANPEMHLSVHDMLNSPQYSK